MIKNIHAHTFEIDNLDIAVTEILEQLNMKENLLSNSIGIMSCYYEFIESGVVAAICDALPFDVIGMTSSRQAVPNSLRRYNSYFIRFDKR